MAAKSTSALADSAGTEKTSKAVALKTQQDKISYALGTNIGNDLKSHGIDVETNALLQGLRDTLTGGKLALTNDEIAAALNALQQTMQAKLANSAKQAGDAGTAFLAANKNKKGVVVLPSGLQYEILTAGTGPKPTVNDKVVCNYAGTLIDGKEFDSSYKRGQPAVFPVNGVIKGWTEALQLMPVGSKWRLYVPSDLAYGPRGAGDDIGPNATLIFDVELLSIQGK